MLLHSTLNSSYNNSQLSHEAQQVEFRNEQIENENDQSEDVRGDDIGDIDKRNKSQKKKYKHSKKNRNIRAQIITLKTKLENLQERSGGRSNFLLIVEDNFSDVHSRGRKTCIDRKMLVAAGGDLRELFKTNNLKYNPESMTVLKEGRKLEPDFSFIDEYVSCVEYCKCNGWTICWWMFTVVL